MRSILAIDTATDACSVALCSDGEVHQLYEVAPRRHNQLIFGMLAQLLPGGDLRARGVEAIAYSSGPGSFTGLRIGASAVQGLAFAHDLPCVPVSTLASQAQRALREGLVDDEARLFSAIDAAIGEIYYAEVEFVDGIAGLCDAPRVGKPAELDSGGTAALTGVGTGCRFVGQVPPPLAQRRLASQPDVLPCARDMLPASDRALERGESVAADRVLPLYVRDEVSWKKLSEQGKPAR